MENILVLCRLKYIPGVGECKIVENMLVPCRLKYILGGGWVLKKYFRTIKDTYVPQSRAGPPVIIDDIIIRI